MPKLFYFLFKANFIEHVDRGLTESHLVNFILISLPLYNGVVLFTRRQ